MGRVTVTRLRKLRRLEGRTAGVAASVSRLEEIRRERLLSEAVALLEDEDLRTLGLIFDAAIEDAEDGGAGARTDLYEYAADARDVSALRALERALADARAASAASARLDEELSRGA
jgi:hypothetical protein